MRKRRQRAPETTPISVRIDNELLKDWKLLNEKLGFDGPNFVRNYLKENIPKIKKKLQPAG